jgi:thymidylate synthase (FAD)
MALPLCMTTKVVVRTNLRMLYDMAKVRKCNRAYWEFRELFNEIEEALSIYSDEWKDLIENKKIFRAKCDWSGFCEEKNSCGRKPKRGETK